MTIFYCVHSILKLDYFLVSENVRVLSYKLIKEEKIWTNVSQVRHFSPAAFENKTQ